MYELHVRQTLTSYSPPDGLIAGLMVYTALNGMIYLTKLLTCGRIVPEDEDQREYWTSKDFAMVLGYSWSLIRILVKPHGKIPWFLGASQALADHVRGRRGSDRGDSASIRDNGWDYQDRLESKGSNQDAELERVHVLMPRDPDREKVLRKL